MSTKMIRRSFLKKLGALLPASVVAPLLAGKVEADEPFDHPETARRLARDNPDSYVITVEATDGEHTCHSGPVRVPGEWMRDDPADGWRWALDKAELRIRRALMNPENPSFWEEAT